MKNALMKYRGFWWWCACRFFRKLHLELGPPCIHYLQGDPSGWQQALGLRVPVAGGQLLDLPTAQAGLQNIPNLIQRQEREVFTVQMGHPVGGGGAKRERGIRGIISPNLYLADPSLPQEKHERSKDAFLYIFHRRTCLRVPLLLYVVFGCVPASVVPMQC